MPTPVETVQDFMATYVKAWPTADPAVLGLFFGEDAVYHNGPLEPVKRARRHRIDLRSVHEDRWPGPCGHTPCGGRRPNGHDRARRSPHESRRHNRFWGVRL